MDLLKDNFTTGKSKAELKKKGFRYDATYSTKDCECYKYSFTVDSYNKTPVIICVFRVYLDNNEVKIDVYDGSGNIYPAWYHRNSCIYAHYKDYIKKIDNKIIGKMKKLEILHKKRGRK